MAESETCQMTAMLKVSQMYGPVTHSPVKSPRQTENGIASSKVIPISTTPFVWWTLQAINHEATQT
jgi:hypothetical protein